MAALPRRIIKETQRLMQEPVPGESRTMASRQPVLIRKHFRNQCCSRREQRQIFSCDCDRSRRLAIRRGTLQARALLARGLPDECSQSALHHQNLSSQHRPTGSNLLRHLERQMEPGTADPHGLAFDTSLTKCPQSGRSARQRCR